MEERFEQFVWCAQAARFAEGRTSKKASRSVVGTVDDDRRRDLTLDRGRLVVGVEEPLEDVERRSRRRSTLVLLVLGRQDLAYDHGDVCLNYQSGVLI